MIQWYVYAIIGALFTAVMQISMKKALENNHPLEFRTTFNILQIPFIMILLCLADINIELWIYLFIFVLAFVAVAGNLYWTKAMKHGQISSVSPLMNLSPLFLVIISYFVLGEKLSVTKYTGIVILMIGTYALEVDHKLSNLKEPIIKIIKDNVFHLVIAALIIYSVANVMEKYILGFVDFLLYWAILKIFMTIIFFTLQTTLYGGYKDILKCWKQSRTPLIFTSIASFLGGMFLLKAMTLQMVALVIPIKRMSTLFSTIIGGEMFHEKGLLLKSMACIILIIGSVLIIM